MRTLPLIRCPVPCLPRSPREFLAGEILGAYQENCTRKIVAVISWWFFFLIPFTIKWAHFLGHFPYRFRHHTKKNRISWSLTKKNRKQPRKPEEKNMHQEISKSVPCDDTSSDDFSLSDAIRDISLGCSVTFLFSFLEDCVQQRKKKHAFRTLLPCTASQTYTVFDLHTK